MIEITRRLARQLRSVFRRALACGTRGGPTVLFRGGPDGLRIQTQNHAVAVEFHLPGDYASERIAVPFEFLADCEGRKDEPVTLEQESRKRIVASWRDGNIPQIVQYPSPSPTEADFPPLPSSMSANEPRLLQALRDAAETTDEASTRYALGCAQLQGAGQVVATDGHQLLVQNGFDFPWKDDVLVPGSKVFGCRELPHDQPISIGHTDEWVSIRVGLLTIHLAIETDRRFPSTADLIRDPQQAATRWRLSSADADFLAESLKRLPVDSNGHSSVTVDLNGQAVIRAKAESQPHPTELLLRGSQLSGEAIRYITDRQYLGRALRLGFRDVCLFDSKTAVACHDEHRHYLWMPLGGDAIGPSKDAIRIESPSDDQPEVPQPPSTPRRHNPMPKTKPSTNGKAQPTKSNNTASDGLEALIDKAEVLRASLREAQSHLGELITGLRQHKRGTKSLRTALQSLRQLQTLEA